MIANNASDIAKELQKYVDEAERKMKAMVAGFAGEVALTASSNTPVATPDLIERWQGIYENRQDSLGIDIAPGYHAGSWKYTEGDGLTFNPRISGRGEVKVNAVSDARSKYKLGDSFQIKAEGPNFDYLVKNNPIKSTTDNAIMAAFAVDAKRYYDQG